MNICLIGGLCALALLAGCAPAGAQNTSAPTVDVAAAAAGAAEAKQRDEAPNDELAGTYWMPVKITSMDDRVDEPDDPSIFRLDLGADGTAAILADCNRGTGAWTSASVGQLRFGPIAATKALCPPGSLSEKYLAQFQWVRSYRMENGHLYLTTMADGSIIEFEPLELPLAATVLGEEVRTSDAGEMQGIVLTRLFDRYAKEQGIEITDAEIDAYPRYLEERQAAGDFTIHEKAFEDEFWRYFTTDSMHSFYAPGSEEEAHTFATPPWERKAAGK